MKDSVFYLIVAVCVLSVCIALVVTYPALLAPEPKISIVQKTYMLQWYGNDTILTVVYPSENVTIQVTHGENFVVNETAKVYDDNQLIINLP